MMNSIEIIFLDALQKQGKELFNNGKHVEAAVTFREAVKVCGNGNERKDIVKHLIMLEAKCYIFLENHVKAIEMYDELLRIDSEFEKAKDLKAASLNELGFLLQEEKKYSDAKDKFQEASEVCSDSNPHRKSFIMNIGMCYEVMEKYSEAIEMYDKALSIDSKLVEARNYKGRILQIQGNILFDDKKYSEASKKFQVADDLLIDLKLKKSNLLQLGICLSEMEKYDRAIEELDKVLKIDSECESAKECKSAALNNHAIILYDEKKYLKASKQYEEAIKLCKNSSHKKIFFVNVAMCCEKLKEFSKCIEMCDNSLSIDGEFETARNLKASALFEQGILLGKEWKFSEAAKKFQHAAETSKKDDKKKFCFAYLGQSLLRTNKFSEAIDALNKSLEIDVEFELAKEWKIETLATHGTSLSQQEKFSEAIEKFQVALNFGVNSEDIKKKIFLNLGTCYCRLKEFKKSIEMYDKALMIDHEFVEAKDNKAAVFNVQGLMLLYDKKLLNAAERFLMAFKICSDFNCKIEYLQKFATCLLLNEMMKS